MPLTQLLELRPLPQLINRAKSMNSIYIVIDDEPVVCVGVVDNNNYMHASYVIRGSSQAAPAPSKWKWSAIK